MKALLTIFHCLFAALAFTALFILAKGIYTTGLADYRYAAAMVICTIISALFYYMAKERV